MKVFVTYENSFEKGLADNLVKVLKKIGNMLCYATVVDGGVRVENWQGQRQPVLECAAVGVGPMSPNRPVAYSAELEYRDGSGYYGVLASPPSMSPYSMSRDQARGIVAMFPGDGTVNANGTPVKKPKVPKPNTTKTGVTIRAIDLDDDHQEEE